MARIRKADEPISYLCDEQVACGGIQIDTASFFFTDSYIIMQQHGWKAWRADDGVWTHACPFCYVDWCRRAKVEPYETSGETTYDEVRALVMSQHPDEGLDPQDCCEPKWYLEMRVELDKKKKRNLAKKLRRQRRDARARSEIPFDKPNNDEYCGPIRFRNGGSSYYEED